MYTHERNKEPGEAMKPLQPQHQTTSPVSHLSTKAHTDVSHTQLPEE